MDYIKFKLDHGTEKGLLFTFEIETYTAYDNQCRFDTEILRYAYQSMATPSSVIDFNMRTKRKTVLKEQKF